MTSVKSTDQTTESEIPTTTPTADATKKSLSTTDQTMESKILLTTQTPYATKKSLTNDDGVIDEIVKSHFVTKNYYISECIIDDVIENSSVENCLESCIKQKCKSFSHSLNNVYVLNNCVSKITSPFTTKKDNDQFVYYGK